MHQQKASSYDLTLGRERLLALLGGLGGVPLSNDRQPLKNALRWSYRQKVRARP
ncbi:Hypothetical protein PMT_2346 [Prochlorococcus marinus str. MIT 9313]|uniref:Uncharacterized protein n=1 Tax=Prochlorococcus marinus (strain MIT 9313) TaxID=74547 RepID=B9ERG9_PROMM|nr:Hypothetical protein PMT_2346 [Prochlorococcus marinus str. MIT 9313]